MLAWTHSARFQLVPEVRDETEIGKSTIGLISRTLKGPSPWRSSKRKSSYQPGGGGGEGPQFGRGFPISSLTLTPRHLAQKERSAVENTPCFCITCRNLMITLDDGRMSTCRLPAFSALLMALRQSLRTEVLTIVAGS